MLTRELLWRAVLAAAAVGAAAVLMVLVASAPVRADKKITVTLPPPPPAADTKPAPAFDYKHEVRTVARDRKPVVALLRPGDVAQMADALPFGRGITVTDAGNFTILRAGRPDDPVFMPPAIKQFLMRELVETREFIVLERERIIEILRELAFAKTGAVDPATAPRPGRLIGVHYIIEGSFFGAGGLPLDDVALENVKREIARRRLAVDPRQACAMYLNVYKVETGEVKAVACGADLQPLVAVRRAVEDLLDQLSQVVEPIKVSQVNPQTGMAVLDAGAEEKIRVGDEFTLGPAGGAPLAKAKVIDVAPLYSVVQVPAESREAVKDGLSAKRVTPPTEPAAPAPAVPPPPLP